MEQEKRSVVMALLLGGVLTLFFYMQVHQALPSERQGAVYWGLCAAIFLLTIGLLFLMEERLYVKWQEILRRPRNWLGVTSLQIILILLSLVFMVLSVNAAGFWIRMDSPYVAVISWMLSILLMMIGCWKSEETWPRLGKTDILWFVLVTMLAFLFRGIATESIPILLTGDEASAGINAAEFASGKWNNIFITGWFSFPTLFTFFQSLFIQVFGQTTEALRIYSAIGGALTVGSVYLCGKAMFGQRAGLFAALILTASHFHVHFSRLGLNNIWDSLWFTVAVGTLWYGWQTQKRWAYLLAGWSLGFSQYFYSSSKLLIPLILISALLAFGFRRQRFLDSLPHVAGGFLTASVVVMPLFLYYWSHPNEFLAPFMRVSVVKTIYLANDAGWNFWVQQLTAAMGAYTYSDLRFWYRPETPILRPIAAPLFYIGLLYLCLENRDSRLVLLTLWLVAFGFAGALSDSTPASQRYVAAAPACALIVGYGLHKIANTVEGLWPKFRKFVAGLAYLLLAVVMISDLFFYFVDYTAFSRLDNIDSNAMVAQQLANILKSMPSGTQVMFMHNSRMGYFSIASTTYLAPHVIGFDGPDDWKSFDRSRLDGNIVLFVFLPESRATLETIQREFPNGSLTVEKSWNGGVLFWLYQYEQN
jgi:4-amino-4-deoxy-L-arabinose transferase-like glycosyltransferase